MILSVKPLGDTAVTVRLGMRFTRTFTAGCAAFVTIWRRMLLPALLNGCPPMDRSPFFMDSHVIRYKELAKRLSDLAADLDRVRLPPARLVVLPTVYGGSGGRICPSWRSITD